MADSLMGLIKLHDRAQREIAKIHRARVYELDERLAETKQKRKADRPRCGAKTRAGGACQAPAVRGGERCRMHGGGGFDGVSVGRYRIENARRKLKAELRTAEVLGGQVKRKPPKIRWTIPADRL